MEHDIGAARHERRCDAGLGEVAASSLDGEYRGGHGRLDDVDQYEVRDRSLSERARTHQRGDQLLAEHARGPGDEDSHRDSRPHNGDRTSPMICPAQADGRWSSGSALAARATRHEHAARERRPRLDAAHPTFGARLPVVSGDEVGFAYGQRRESSATADATDMPVKYVRLRGRGRAVFGCVGAGGGEHA